MRHEHAEVLIATTWRCNLRCTYCFVEEQKLAESGARMSPELARRVVDALDVGLADVRRICLHLYGGEPLTNLAAVEAMLERADDKEAGRFAFAVTTNGTCLSERTLELLDRGRFQIVLSIDGPAEIHDECRRAADGGPTHARVLEFLELVRAHTRCTVRGSAVVRSGWRLAEAEEYLRSLPVDAIKAQAVRGPEGAPYVLSDEERRLYLADLEAVGEDVIDSLEEGRAPLDDRYSSRVLQLLAGMRRESFCAAGDTTFGITPEGDVRPCVLLEGDGDLLGRIDDPSAAWREAGRRWRAARRPRAECESCRALPLCGGGCPAMMPVCGADECELVRKNCEVAEAIYERFRHRPEDLLTLAGVP